MCFRIYALKLLRFSCVVTMFSLAVWHRRIRRVLRYYHAGRFADFAEFEAILSQQFDEMITQYPRVIAMHAFELELSHTQPPLIVTRRWTLVHL